MKSRHGKINVNLKGKKNKRLSCGCCSVFNLKDKYFKHFWKKELNEDLSGV